MFFCLCSLVLAGKQATGYLPACRQGISDFGSEVWGFPACRQTGNPSKVTVVPKTSKVILEVFLWHLLNKIFKKIQHVI
jgi:hypothetical protein